jgi:hypothetical protein
MESGEHALRIDYSEKEKVITLTVLRASRFKNFGFGTFLIDIQPAEISISQKALSVILACPYRRGLQGMEIWGEHRLAWGSLEHEVAVSPDEICCEELAKEWLRTCSVN